MAQLINKVSVKKDMTSFKNVNVATTSNSKNYESDDDMDYGTNSTAINNFTSDVFRKFVKSNGDKRTIESDDYFYHDRRSSPGLFRPVSIDDHTEEVESDKQNAYNTLPTIHEYTENGPLLHIEGKDEGQQERPKNDAPMYLSTQHQVASGPSDTAVQQTFGTTANENFDNGDYRLGTNTPEFVGHGGDFQPAQDEAFSSPSTGLNVFGTPLPILNEFQNQHGQFQHSQYVIQTPHGPALLLGRDGGGGYGTGNAATAPNNNTLMSPLQVTHPNPHDVNAISSVPSIQVKPTASTNRKFQRWSDEEDQLLKDAVEREPGPPYNWRKIANLHFPSSRTSSQCKSRWTKCLQPGIVRGSWQPEEDEMIVELRSEGLKWYEIAERLPGRIGEHVRERYVNYLDPCLKRSPWTAEEDQILFREQRRVGNKWTEISRFIPGRSENSVKNRWHNAKMTQRRRMRRQAAERSRMEHGQRARQHGRANDIIARTVMVTATTDEPEDEEDYSPTGSGKPHHLVEL